MSHEHRSYLTDRPLQPSLRPLTPLKRRRLELGLRQADVAAAAGISQSHLSRLESGRQRPSLDTAIRLAAAVDILPELI